MKYKIDGHRAGTYGIKDMDGKPHGFTDRAGPGWKYTFSSRSRRQARLAAKRMNEEFSK